MKKHSWVMIGKGDNRFELCMECGARHYPFAKNYDPRPYPDYCKPSDTGKEFAKNTIEAYKGGIDHGTIYN